MVPATQTMSHLGNCLNGMNCKGLWPPGREWFINNYHFLWHKWFWRTAKVYWKSIMPLWDFPIPKINIIFEKAWVFFYLVILHEELFCTVPQVKCISWNSLSSLLPFLSFNSTNVYKHRVWLRILKLWLNKKSSFTIDFLSGIFDILHAKCSPLLQGSANTSGSCHALQPAGDMKKCRAG